MNKVFAVGCAAVLLLGGLILTAVLLVISFTVSTLNKEVQLRNQIAKQDQVNRAIDTKVWRVLSEKAQIPVRYAEDFKQIYPELISGRYKNGGGLMKWIQEHNPEFDTSLYKDLMISVSAERALQLDGFETVSRLKQEHDTLIDQPISGFVLNLFGHTEKTTPVIPVQTATQQAFETGVDDRTLKLEPSQPQPETTNASP